MTSPLSEALDRAIPITQVGGLTRAIYPTTETDADGWAVETPVIDAARSLLAGQPIQWCEVHESRVRVGPGGRPGDERCERAELHLAFQPSVGVRACKLVSAVLLYTKETE